MQIFVIGKNRTAIAPINPQFAKLDDGQTVRFLDLGPKFLAAAGTLPKELRPDSLHLSEKGDALWAGAMEPLLKERRAQ